MFAKHLKKIDETPYKTLLWVAAGLVFVCQLVAFAFVADGQVTKAQIREFQRKAEMQAIANYMIDALKETKPRAELARDVQTLCAKFSVPGHREG